MKETIKTVAIDLFFRKGYFATSISDIAKGCGIQKASIYYHFPGKEDLLFSIMENTMIDLLASLENNLAACDNHEDQMRGAVRSHVMFHLNRQKETFIASSELAQPYSLYSPCHPIVFHVYQIALVHLPGF